jgi:hypothetical protein
MWGGYVSDKERAENKAGLDDISLDWMIRRVCKISKDTFPIAYPKLSDTNTNLHLAAQHEPRDGIYRFLPFVWRSLFNIPVPVVRRLERNVCHDRHGEAIGEAIHISAIQRLGCEVRIDNKCTIYAPRNLLILLEKKQSIKIVGWDGECLPHAAAKSVVREALKRLKCPVRLRN